MTTAAVAGDNSLLDQPVAQLAWLLKDLAFE